MSEAGPEVLHLSAVVLNCVLVYACWGGRGGGRGQPTGMGFLSIIWAPVT